jgi:hypothetical protein
VKPWSPIYTKKKLNNMIKGYKIFNPDLTCRNFQYKVGETYELNSDPILCNKGFHFCKELKDVYNYYRFDYSNPVCEIEALGTVIDDLNDNKSVTNKIKIVRILDIKEILFELNLFCSGNQGSYNRGSGNRGSINQGSSNQGSFNRGSSNQGSSNQGSSNRGSGNQGSSNQGSDNQGSNNQGSSNRGSYNRGSNNQGSSNRGSGNRGSYNQGSDNQGSYNRGSNNQGSSNQGSYNLGSCSVGFFNTESFIGSTSNCACFNTLTGMTYFSFLRKYVSILKDVKSINKKSIISKLPNYNESLFDRIINF